MSEKNQNLEANQARKERFEFVLTSNDYIVCQRYFRIHNFKAQSLTSEELIDTFNRVKGMIDDDLKSKSRLYLTYTAPQVYENYEEMMNHSADWPNLEAPSYVVLRDTKEVYVWKGEEMKPYNGFFNTSDYCIDENAEVLPSVLKLSFYDNGYDLSEHNEVMSCVWDGNVYPRFVRNNIDLSNTKNKYKADGVYSPYEATLVDLLNADRKDLIPIIVKEFADCCSCEDNESVSYTRRLVYDNTSYRLNLADHNDKYEKAYEKWYLSRRNN